MVVRQIRYQSDVQSLVSAKEILEQGIFKIGINGKQDGQKIFSRYKPTIKALDT